MIPNRTVMSLREEELLSLELPCDFGAPAVVRAELEKFEWLGWVLGDLLLISTELINCVVLRCGADGEHPLRVAGRLTDGHLRLEVTTAEGRSAPSEADEDPVEEEWRQMIIAQLAASWGEEDAPGYGIWAEVEVPEASVRRLPRP
jgi:hypothetical protein